MGTVGQDQILWTFPSTGMYSYMHCIAGVYCTVLLYCCIALYCCDIKCLACFLFFFFNKVNCSDIEEVSMHILKDKVSLNIHSEKVYYNVNPV